MANFSEGTELCLYAFDVTRVRINFLIFHPWSRNCIAKWSRSFGWVGGSPCPPKSSSLRESPYPKKIFQIRLVNARAGRGLSFETTHFARSSRLALRFSRSSFPMNSGIAGSTTSPDLSSQLPRGRIRTILLFPDWDTSMDRKVFL